MDIKSVNYMVVLIHSKINTSEKKSNEYIKNPSK